MLSPWPIGAGRLDVFDGSSGRLRATIPLRGVPARMAIDEQSERVYVVDAGIEHQEVETLNPHILSAVEVHDGAGSVVTVDARKDSVLSTLPAGVSPGMIAVDTTAGRIYAVNEGGPIRAANHWGWVPRWLRQRLPFLPSPGSARQFIPSSVTVLQVTR